MFKNELKGLSYTSICDTCFGLIHSIKIEIQAGKESAVDFTTGQEAMVYKAKNGHLMVVSRADLLL